MASEQAKREIARRLGAPYRPCCRCNALFHTKDLCVVFFARHEVGDACRACAALLQTEEKQREERRVRERIRQLKQQREITRAVADAVLATDRPSSAAYRDACAAMAAEWRR